MKLPGQHSKPVHNLGERKPACVWVLPFLFFCLLLYFVVEYRNHPNGCKLFSPNQPLPYPPPPPPPSCSLGYILHCSLSSPTWSHVFPLIVILFTYIAISRVLEESNIFIKAVKQAHKDMVDDQQCSSLSNIKRLCLKQNRRDKKILTPLVLVFAVTMLLLNILRLTLLFLQKIGQKEYYQAVLYVVIVSTKLYLLYLLGRVVSLGGSFAPVE